MRRVARGQCWFPVRLGRSYYNSLNRFVVEVARDEVADDVDSAFEYGQIRSDSFYMRLLLKIIYRNFPVMVVSAMAATWLLSCRRHRRLKK